MYSNNKILPLISKMHKVYPTPRCEPIPMPQNKEIDGLIDCYKSLLKSLQFDGWIKVLRV